MDVFNVVCSFNLNKHNKYRNKTTKIPTSTDVLNRSLSWRWSEDTSYV